MMCKMYITTGNRKNKRKKYAEKECVNELYCI